MPEIGGTCIALIRHIGFRLKLRLHLLQSFLHSLKLSRTHTHTYRKCDKSGRMSANAQTVLHCFVSFSFLGMMTHKTLLIVSRSLLHYGYDVHVCCQGCVKIAGNDIEFHSDLVFSRYCAFLLFFLSHSLSWSGFRFAHLIQCDTFCSTGLKLKIDANREWREGENQLTGEMNGMKK